MNRSLAAPSRAELSAATPAAPVVQRQCACGTHTPAGGECGSCARKRGQLQRRAAFGPEPEAAVAPPIVHEVLRRPGRPLDEATRAFFEPRFGHDFSHVRVHTDAQAAESARAVNALAYTVGRNVVFGAGKYAPDSTDGRRLLAHELTHVVQQQGVRTGSPSTLTLGDAHSGLEVEADRIAQGDPSGAAPSGAAGCATPVLQRRVRAENVSCRGTGLRNPDLTGAEAVAAIEAADAAAITLALRAELLLDSNLLFARAGEPVDAEFDTILQEELGLTLTNPAHFRLIEQQSSRFRRVRETLESGYLRYICRGSDPITLQGCAAAARGDDFAFSCPGNRLIVLCQAFWDEPAERAPTILHEPFHIWFDMERHNPGALRRADASCFESFALRVAGEPAPASCVDHTGG